MTVQLNSRTFDELSSVISELETLTSKPGNLTGREDKRHAFLLAKMAMLRSGVSVGELRHFETERLLAEAGLPPNAVLRGDWEANKAFRQFLITGESRGCDLPAEFREIRTDNIAGSQSISYTNGDVGGYYVPEGYHADVIQSLTQYDEILSPDYSNQWDSATGQPLAYPAIDDFVSTTANRSVITAEGAQSTQHDVVAASVQFPTAATFRSGRLFVSIELIQDSPIIMQALTMAINRRHAIGVGEKFITGAGTGVIPEGLTANLPSGQVTTSASTTLALVDFENVYAKLDASYRKNAVWFMADGTRSIITKLLETSGRTMVGPVNELLRCPIAVCNSMAAVSAGTAAVAVLADRRYISQRFVPKATSIKRFEQALGYVEYGLIGIEGYLRCSQRMILFSSVVPPVASLTVHA